MELICQKFQEIDEAAAPHVEAVWESARTRLGGSLLGIKQGDMGLVLYAAEKATDREPTHVIKLVKDNYPFDQEDQVAFESKVVSQLDHASTAPPVSVPRFLAKHAEGEPPWVAFSYVHGEQLTYADIRQRFSGEDLERFAHGIGKFVRWFSDAIPMEKYVELEPPPLPNRASLFLAASAQACKLDKSRYPSFTRVSDAIRDDYEFYEAIGAFRPPYMIGHDDLHPDNLTFAERDGRWRLHGVFDSRRSLPRP